MLNALFRSARRGFKTSIYPHVPAALRQRYQAYRFGRRYQLPNTLYLETTSACNLNCVMCAAQRPATKTIKPSGYMDVALFRRLIDEIVRDLPAIESIYLHKDGEPLLHPHIVEMIEYASSRHPRVTLVTNATLLDETLARAILATPLQNIRFSVDGVTKATFEKIRIQLLTNEFAHTPTPVGYDAVMTNIERFLALRTATGNRTMSVGMRTTDFKPTSNEVATYTAHWIKKVEFVEVAPLISWSGEIRKEDHEELREPCMSPWSSLVVSWDGALVPCCTYIDSGHGKGKLFDLTTGSIMEALKAEKRKALMRAHLDNHLQDEAPYCVPCRDWRAIPIPTRGRAGVLEQLRKVAT